MKSRNKSVRRGSFLDCILMGIQFAFSAFIGWCVFRMMVDLLLCMTQTYDLITVVLKNDVICGLAILMTMFAMYLVWLLGDYVQAHSK